jgi:GPH family glycoside/pentoside/hexuronide:cation symporter/probable glucitol transport protein GutA
MFLFLPTQNLSDGVKIALAAFGYILYDTANTALDIPIRGVQPLLFVGQEERNKAVSWSQTLGSLGTILPMGLYFGLVAFIGRGDEKDPLGHFITASLIIGLGCLSIYLSSRHLKEKIVLPKAETNVLKNLKIVFKNGPLLLLLLVSLLAAPLGMSYGAMVFFADWNFVETPYPMWLLFPAIQLSSGITWMLSIMMVPWLLKFTTKKKLFIMMGIIGVFANIGVWFVGFENVYAYVIVKFFAYLPNGIIATLTMLLIADTVEFAEWKTGQRTEGATFAIVSLVTKTSAAVIAAFTLFLMAFAGYQAETMQVARAAGESINITFRQVQDMIFILMTLTLSVAFLLQIIPMFFYKFDGKYQADILRQLRERRAAKQAEAGEV